jgi:hypothetical protein
MRKAVFLLLALILVAAATWLFAGQRVVLLLDRFRTVEVSNQSARSLNYDGNGTGGVLHLEATSLSLNETAKEIEPPHIGTTKAGELALSYGGQVFSFGTPVNSETLSIRVPEGDTVSIELRRSCMPWPNLLDFNFMTGKSAVWKRNRYQHLVWKKPDDAQLEMWWRYEQYYYASEGWVDGFMTNPGLTGLIAVQIKSPRSQP